MALPDYNAEYEALCSELGIAPDCVDKLRAENAELREALAALIDDVDALSALRDCDWEPHLDCAVDTADKYRALLEAQDG